jgi:serine/threonine-protein kinase PRP4
VTEDGDDGDDMFAAVAPVKKTKRVRKKRDADKSEKPATSGMVIIDRAHPSHVVVDDQDDAEGYYRVILGELLDDGRYHVHSNLGKGMFSSVVRAKDLQDEGKEVAIKMIRSQETMCVRRCLPCGWVEESSHRYKAAQKEVGILKKLNEADPTDKRHLVRLHRTFEHRGHLCLVFESLRSVGALSC